MAFYLAIVSPLDAPLYETSFASSKPSSSGSTSSPSSSFPSWSSFTTSSASSTNGDETTPASAKLGGQLGLISNSGGPALERHLAQMVAFAALDSVDEVVETTGSLYLRSVDRHNQWIVSAFIATNVKFVLLHDHKNDDGIRLFFLDLWELYVKTSLNPFHTVDTPIRSPAFDGKVKACAKRNL